MALVNGIPTSDEFKRRLGRTGLSNAFKMKDPTIDRILRHLHDAEVWRDREHGTAVQHLRRVRAECIRWIVENNKIGKRRAARPRIVDLLNNVHARINVVVESVHGRRPKTARQNWNELLHLHDLTDEKGKALPHRPVGRKLDKHYILERAGKSHFVGHNLTQAKMRWDVEVNRNATKLDFDEWINYVWIPQSEDDPTGVYIKYHTSIPGKYQAAPAAVGQLDKQRVKYCDAEERKDYVITIRGGQVRDATGSLYHTGSKQTHFSGMGWAIYVIDHSSNWYSASHRVGHFHHSSFMSGGPVKAAGEIAVDQGRAVAITNKTGHYKAGPDELAAALTLLHRGGVDLSKIAVSDPFMGPGKWYDGQTFINVGCDAKRAQKENKKTIPKPPKVAP